MSFFGTTEFLIEVGKGNVPGHTCITVPGNKQADVSISGFGDISEVPSVLVLPNPGGIQLEIVSDNANDTSAGSGVQSVDIHYLDETTGLGNSEIVILNGLTPVNTVDTNIGNIQWMHAQTVGSGGVPAGNISL